MAPRNNKARNDNGSNNGGTENMAKLNKGQQEVIASFFETVGWGDDDAAELAKLNESLEKATQAVKTLQAEIQGFGVRKDKAAELLSWFDGGPLGATASADDKVAFLCTSMHVKPKRAASSGDSTGPVAKATDEEKEAVLESLDGEGKTVGEIAKETGMETKDVSRIAKALLNDGMARKEGERRGTRYFLVSEAIEDDSDEEETEE